LYSINRFNSNNLIVGFLNNGVVGIADNWKHTDYIPCKKNDHIYCAKTQGNNLPCVELYDGNYNFIKQVYSSSISSAQIPYDFYIDDVRVMYLRYNVFPVNLFAYINQFLIVETSVYINSIYYVGSTRTGSNTFTTLKACTEYISKNNIQNAKVYVDSGVYDLSVEYGSTYLESLVSATNKGFGLHVGNNTHYVFAYGAKVKFNYAGTNNDCAEYFSAFNITGSVILENADIDASNCRYCVHEDLPTSADVIPTK
jgi:hypothetical protein